MATTTETVTSTVDELSLQLSRLGVEDELPQVNGTDVLARPTDIFRSHLAGLLVDAFQCDINLAYGAIAESSNCDLEVKIPKLKLSGGEDPSELLLKFKTSWLFSAPYLEGKHIIGFFYNPNALAKVLFPFIRERAASYGCFTAHGQQGDSQTGATPDKVLVEFSSPNVGPEFNGTHLRSTLLGAFVSNVYECMGSTVTRISYLGDWGKEVAFLVLGFQKFGSEEKLQAEPLAHMLDVYTQMKELSKPQQEELKRAKDEGRSTVEIESTGVLAERDACCQSLEKGDEEAVALWKRLKGLAVDQLGQSYSRLGIKFDELTGESQVKPETMTEVEQALKEEDVLEEGDDGSLFVDFEKHAEKAGKSGKGLGSQALRGRDGTTSYLLRDLGAALERERSYSFDKMIYVVSSRQSTHFQQLSVALRLMKRDALEEKIQHVAFGEVLGLSEQVNGPLLLNSILDKSAAHANSLSDEAEGQTDAAADGGVVTASDNDVVSGMVFQEMNSKKRGHSYQFDAKRMLSSSEGEDHSSSGLYDMHKNLLDKITELDSGTDGAEIDYTALQDESHSAPLALLAKYPETTATAFKNLEPHTIFQYLLKIVEETEGLMEEDGGGEEPVNENGAGPAPKEDEEETAKASSEMSPGARKAMAEMYRCTAQILENGMKLLGFPPPPATVSWN